MPKFNHLIILLLIAIILFATIANGQKEIPDYSMTERKDIPVEYTWKIEDIYPSIEAWQEDKEAVVKLLPKIDEYSKDWTSSPQKMLAMAELYIEISKKLGKLGAYAGHQSNTDLSNTQFQGMRGEIQSLGVQMSSKVAFFNPDILALGAEKFNQYLKTEPKLEPYRFTVEQILRGEDHILPTEQQEIVSMTGLFAGTSSKTANMLNNVEIPHVEVTLSDGNKVTLNFANFSRYRASNNPDDRSIVMRAYWNNHKKFENTLAALLDGSVKKDLFNAKTHKYKDCLEAHLFDDNIDTEVYHQLISSIRNNLKPLHRYLTLKKNLLGLEKYRYDDIYASSVPTIEKYYTYDEAKKIIVEMMKPLGNDYNEALKLSFANRWIDLYPNKGKESGAYSSGVYGVHPFVLMNFDGKYNEVSTLAHELGHSLHSYFSQKTQHYVNAQYTIFLAEIASTFNENMMMNYLLKNEKDDLFKLYLLDSYLDRFRSTVYRQTLFAEFELAMHRRVEEGKTLTPDWLNKLYLDLTREYYGHDKGICEVDDYIQCEWSRIPHFYRDYYVYQYSTGLIASMALTDMVVKGGKAEQNRYLDFLKAGGSDYPLAILKKAGVDMTSPAPADAAFKRFDQYVTEMEKIVERLKKQNKL